MITPRPQTNLTWPQFIIRLIALGAVFAICMIFLNSLNQAVLKHQSKLTAQSQAK